MVTTASRGGLLSGHLGATPGVNSDSLSGHVEMTARSLWGHLRVGFQHFELTSESLCRHSGITLGVTFGIRRNEDCGRTHRNRFWIPRDPREAGPEVGATIPFMAARMARDREQNASFSTLSMSGTHDKTDEIGMH